MSNNINNSHVHTYFYRWLWSIILRYLEYFQIVLLYRGDILEAVLTCGDLKEKLIDKVTVQLNEECKLLCSFKFGSLLRKYSPKQLSDFNMNYLMSEQQQETPLLYHFLTTASLYHPQNTEGAPLCGWFYPAEIEKYSYVFY